MSDPSWSVVECVTDGGAVDVLATCHGTTPGGILLHAASVCQRLTFGEVGEFSDAELWFGGAALQEVVTVNGLSTPATAINLSAPSCLVAKMCKGGVVDDGADILARCATTTPAVSLRAPTFGLVSGAATKPSYDFGGDVLQVATSVNGLSIPVTANRGSNGAGL